MAIHRFITENPPNTGVAVGALNGSPLTQEQMYVRCNFPVPTTIPDGFDLVMPGRELRFITTEDLASFQEVTEEIVLECAGNGRTLMDPVPDGTAWALDGASPITITGYRLNEILGPLPDDVVELVFTGADRGMVDGQRIPYQFSISRELAQSTVPLLVTHIGGLPLTLQHGAPIRLIVPGHYAMKSVKWLARVETATTPFRGHFVEKYRYYQDTEAPEGTPVAEIAVRAVITSPGQGETVNTGALDIRGSAWSGGPGVSMVEVSTDDGETWHRADLAGREVDGRWAPVRWSFTTHAEPGPLTIVARASDADGVVQPLEPRWNAKGHANNVVQRVTVDVTNPSSPRS